MLTQARLKELFKYDPLTGLFYNKVARGTKAKMGAKAGNLSTNGYIQLCVYGKYYSAHRLAWLYSYGELPALEIDHINGIRTDNRVANLRLATRAQNVHNSLQVGVSGIKGVTWDKVCSKWYARVSLAGKTKRKKFSSLDEAAEWVRKVRLLLHGDFANHGAP